MLLKPFLRLLRNNQLFTLIAVNALFKPFYKLTYLAAAKGNGVLDLLVAQPLSFEELADVYCKNDKSREALLAWLQLGVSLKLLTQGDGKYHLRSMAQKLAQPQNDAALALLQEVATLHHKLVLSTPDMLKLDRLWSLEDQSGEMTTRSSRTLEAFLIEAIDANLPTVGEISLLEIGCGSAIYMKYAASRNPSLFALGLELQPDVAALARANIERWGLETRCKVDVGDIRSKSADSVFEIATLFNNIYYFPVARRVSLLTHVKRFIRPGGFLLLTTCCQGGGLGVEVLNLWGAATANAGRLPYRQEMIDQLYAAGYLNVHVTSLVPGDAFFCFKAFTPAG